MQKILIPDVDSPAMRHGGADVLSLALMDARNHTLHLISQFEPEVRVPDSATHEADRSNPPLWTLGHIGWFQERWVARNLQRHLGRQSDPTATRLPSIEPNADAWWDPEQMPIGQRWALNLPDIGTIKAYLLETLEASLELLEKSKADDDALYFFRLALFHEDQAGEALITLAQSMGLPLGLSLPGPVLVQAPLNVPATRWALGVSEAESGFSFDNERPAFEVQVPEFDIDAQVVTWAQFVEFVDDGGYDRPELWHPDGWAWAQMSPFKESRRAPRYVDQIGVASGAVMQDRFGTPRRMLGGQPAMHVSWWEADAWCRWAGRRLPSEVEWEAAAHSVVRRRFRWGDVWEWMGTTFQAYPDFVPDPDRAYSAPHFGTHKVLRGASFATRARMKHPKFRYFALPGQDGIFVGFRSCSL
jgi:ergothioneine biosynthesis protein EgtB